jgi:hypothetical protein
MRNKKSQFKVQEFKDWVNLNLKRTDDEATDNFKKGLCEALEHVLRECNFDIEYDYNYWKETGYMQWMKAGEPQGDQKQMYILGPSGQEYNRTYS